MSTKNSQKNDKKIADTKNERASRKTRPLTLDELKEVNGGTFTCDSNGPPGVHQNAY